jgi:subtilase family serine protease
VEWAHAIAPRANILLVEASSATFASLMAAVDYAAAHAHVVSMSWGASDFAGETGYDYHFNRSGVVFTAASGDSGTGVLYPAASPYVVAVGGTTLHLSGTGALTAAETAWSGSGGGVSPHEAEPGYQTAFGISSGSKRGSPDVSYDANPGTGFAVYDSTPYAGLSGWMVFGGTSAGAPQWAALVALADQARVAAGRGYLSSNGLSAAPEYGAATGASSYAANYRDVTSGSNGGGSSVTLAHAGYDFVTGLGSPLANKLVPYLAAH